MCMYTVYNTVETTIVPLDSESRSFFFFLFFFFFSPPKSRLPVKSPDKISSKSTRSPNKTLSNEIKISRLHINYGKKKIKK